MCSWSLLLCAASKVVVVAAALSCFCGPRYVGSCGGCCSNITEIDLILSEELQIIMQNWLTSASHTLAFGKMMHLCKMCLIQLIPPAKSFGYCHCPLQDLGIPVKKEVRTQGSSQIGRIFCQNQIFSCIPVRVCNLDVWISAGWGPRVQIIEKMVSKRGLL